MKCTKIITTPEINQNTSDIVSKRKTRTKSTGRGSISSLLKPQVKSYAPIFTKNIPNRREKGSRLSGVELSLQRDERRKKEKKPSECLRTGL